ncbi:MAG: alpha/beta hydrolase family protein, partial [Planctomyces sp.]
ISWGGSSTGQPPVNPLEGAEPGDPATDWGSIDPTQLNVAGYASVLPGPQQLLTDREDPRNNNWYILTLGCQRALTFLEQQPEVDAERLGVHGYSMGGNLTMYTAAADRRVRVAVPGVGGAGWRWQLHEFAGDRGRAQDHVTGDLDLFRRTLSFESVAPLIRCPVLHRSATNDFHGWMDDVYRTNLLIPDQQLRYSWTIHMNHRLAEETAVALPLWLDQHLRGGPALPDTPAVRLLLSAGESPRVQVHPARHDWAVDRCEVYYSVDGDPRARFWRSADVVAQPVEPPTGNGLGTAAGGGQWLQAGLPLESLERPLFVFANVFYRLPQPVDMSELPGFREPVQRLCLSSELLSAAPQQLQTAAVQASLQRGSLIDDFSRGLRDWYQLNAGHVSLVQTWTRKLTDPLYQGAAGARLRISLRMERTNWLTFVIVQNEWRNYRGPRQTWICEREIAGGDEVQQLELATEDFVAADGSGAKLADWSGLDQFGVCAHFSERRERTGVRPWQGAPASLQRLEWV